MVDQPMRGVRIVEVAQFTFTPSAGAVLADWGADVIKIEHAEAGDAQRGLLTGMGGATAGSFHPLMEHPNRGKRSIGLALEVPSGHDVLMELVRSADVFLTNFLPDARRRLRIEVEDIRAVNPNIIYARGSGHGQRGPDAEKGGYDGSTFWCRTGSAMGRHSARQPASDRDARWRLWRLTRRYDDCWGDCRCTLFPRTNKGTIRRRRLPHECRCMGHGPISRHLINDRPGDASGSAQRASKPGRQSHHRPLPDLRRTLDQLHHAPARTVLRRCVQAPRHRASPRR